MAYPAIETVQPQHDRYWPQETMQQHYGPVEQSHCGKLVRDGGGFEAMQVPMHELRTMQHRKGGKTSIGRVAVPEQPVYYKYHTMKNVSASSRRDSRLELMLTSVHSRV